MGLQNFMDRLTAAGATIDPGRRPEDDSVETTASRAVPPPETLEARPDPEPPARILVFGESIGNFSKYVHVPADLTAEEFERWKPLLEPFLLGTPTLEDDHGQTTDPTA